MGHLLPARLPLLAAAVAALLLVSGTALAVADPPPQRIVGGEVADPGDWRFAAALEIKLRDRKVLDCGASVISPRYAITAAHCVVSVDPREFSLVVGRANLRRAGQGAEVKVTRSKIHPGYGPPNFRNDVAILELKRRVSVPPVALPTVGQNDALTTVGSPLQVAGWGGTRPNGSRPSKRLRTMTETVVKPAKCRKTYGHSFSAETTICTRGPKLAESEPGYSGSCYGDSGGPLVADTPGGTLLIGTVSGGGLRCGTSPDYYARVSDTLRFIRRVTGVTPASP